MAEKQEVMRLKGLAYEMRMKLIDLCGTYSGAVHIGGDLSMTDLLIGLFHHGMNVDPTNPKNPERDRFILSKGHGAVCMYIAMALRGFWSYEDIVSTYGQLDSAYGMHPCRTQLPALECSSGSLGQGLAMAVGMAISAKNKKEKYRVFCMLGDGETCEGEVWEAATTAHSFDLGNLVAIVDRNKQFMTTFSEELVKLEPYCDKWRAFGWNVVEINGNDMAEIVDALDQLPPADSDTPTVIVANTIKGKTVSFMERNIGWHAGKVSEADWQRAKADIQADWDRERSAD
jgi:transketolase